MTEHSKGHAAIIGAGVVGICSAAFLQREGYRVTLVDAEEPGTMTSYGNAGAISAHSVTPMALPGIWKKVPRWLLDPLGPLAVRLGYAPRAAPWLIKFMKAAGDYETQAKALADLHRPVREAYLELTRDDAGANDLLKQTGALAVYETEQAFAGDVLGRELSRSHGHRVEELGPDELRQLEPALAPIFKKATYFPDATHCINPGKLCRRLATMVFAAGGQHLKARVARFETGPDGVTALITDQGARHEFDHFVIAAGAWSHQLSSDLGEPFPLESERGYHMVLPHPGVETSRPISFGERKFMCTNMEMGLRLAGTVEFAGLKAEPNWGRAEKLLTHASQIFRDVDTSDAQPWMGQRPATPDSLPVISRSKKHKNVVYGFGHGHLGLTGGAVTGKHVTALIAGRTPDIDLSPFSIARFA
ncbi:MAG TPA: FAD-dependent oxidoreductase [Alphaproteobacteria bacterium]|nr:FAD-dependent oxidoreductase [Alphaproteobacteria bacterium]